MKLLVRTIIVSLLAVVVYILIGLARNTSGQIEFNGHRYASLDAARQAAGRSMGARDTLQLETGEDVALFCGQRLTILALILGFYGPYDPMICFATEADSDRLYAENRALEVRYKPLAEKVLPTLATASLIIVLTSVFRNSRKRKRR